MALLALQGVSHRYEGEARTVEALRGVDLSIRPGERLAIVGRSGSGKTTLAHAAALVLIPTEGRVEWDGADARGLTHAERARKRLIEVGLVFQQFYLHPSLTAADNVALPALESGVDLKNARAGARDLLERMELAPRADHRPGELSGGEQQRVALARALVNRPRLIVADEPTGELDAESAGLVARALAQASKETGAALLLATHDRELAKIAERTVTLADGRIVA